MKLIPKILLGTVGVGTAVAVVVVVNPFGIASNIPGLQQARYSYITAAAMAGIDPKTVASEKDVCLASNMFSHGAVYEWHDEPQYIGIQDVTYGSKTDASPEYFYQETYRNCVSWRPSLSTRDGELTFASPEEYFNYSDAEKFETFWHTDSTPYLLEQTGPTQMADGARARYEKWQRENNKL